MKIWIFLYLIEVGVLTVVCGSTECGTKKANYFTDFWGRVFVHYSYESLVCSHGCCGSVSDRYCCSPAVNHVGTVVGGATGGVFALFMMIAISLFLCKYYNMKKNMINPEPSCEFSGSSQDRSVRYNSRKQTIRIQVNEPPPPYRPSTSGEPSAPCRTELPPPYRSNEERY